MLRLLSDENFNGDVVRGLKLLKPELDLIRTQDTHLLGASDDELLHWCAENNRLVVTHDRATMPEAAFARVLSGKTMPGVFIFRDRLPVRDMIEELLLIDECSEQTEWDGLVVYLPL